MKQTIFFREKEYELSHHWKNEDVLLVGFGSFLDNDGDDFSILCEFDVCNKKCIINAWYGDDVIAIYSECPNKSVYEKVFVLTNTEIENIKSYIFEIANLNK